MNNSLETVRAVVAFVALAGGALGGYNLMDNASEAPPRPRVATPQAPAPAPAPVAAAEPELIIEQLPAPVVDKSPPDPSLPVEVGSNAQARADEGMATCECSCEESEGLGERLTRYLPFLSFLPGL